MNYLSKVTLKPNLTAKRLFIEAQIHPNRHAKSDTHTNSNVNSNIKPKLQDPYRVHQALWQLFELPAGSDRPFLYREYNRYGETFYYVLSTVKPIDAHPFFAVETKDFDPDFYEGQRLAFELRANPVATITDAQGKSSRHDVLMMAKKRLQSQAFDNKLSRDEALYGAMYDAGVDWITNPNRMANWGVRIHPNLELSSYTQHRFRRSHEDLGRETTTDKRDKKSRLIQFSSLDYEGALEINDAKLFFECMLKGFGKQKAFGCGLMLVRPLRYSRTTLKVLQR